MTNQTQIAVDCSQCGNCIDIFQSKCAFCNATNTAYNNISLLKAKELKDTNLIEYILKCMKEGRIMRII